MAPSFNQIQTWLKQSEVWRFVGFASAVVGLLCYALSSSFNSLFGEWNLPKTFLYSVFSFLICSAVLFAKVWQCSSSLRLKAHMVFLVLTITSFYSFFFDKAANGKPDAYALVSCSAFAVMSLSLSRQTHCGFELDLLYFFLGALIVQLMRIKWMLGIVGAGFSYSLIILRSYLDGPPEANGYIELQDQPQVVIPVASLQLQSGTSSGLVVAPQEGNTRDDAITEVDSHSQEDSTFIALIKPQLLASVKALKKQNRKLIHLLYANQILGERFQPDHNLFIDALPSEIINNLNKIVKLAVTAGFEKECYHMYIRCRREFLRQYLSTLESHDFNNEDDNISKTTVRIQSWIRAFEIAVRILFPNERGLYDRVFFGPSSAADVFFVQICKEPIIRLLDYAKTFAVEVRSPKIFKEVVQVFLTLRDMIPELESLFPDQYVSLRNEAITTRKRLGEAIRNVFKDLENLIHCDTAVADAPGAIYPITRDVMNCLSGVMEVSPVIEKVLEEYPMVTDGGGMSPSLLAEMAGIMELLDSHLEAKSENYIEPALGYVSMMNNAMYIKRSIKPARIIDEDGGNFFGFNAIFRYDQVTKYTAKVQRYIEDYQRTSWNEVLGLLKLDSEEELVAPDVAAESMKEKLKLFNIQFEEKCNIQSEWFANDDTRKDIIISLENMLLPAYGKFIGRFQDVLGKNAYKYIQYGMFDIKARLKNLFLGGKRMNL